MIRVRLTSPLHADTSYESESPHALSLLTLALKAKAPLLHRCGGHARCATCRICILEGHQNVSPMGTRERELLQQHGAGPQERLACQAWAQGSVQASF